MRWSCTNHCKNNAIIDFCRQKQEFRQSAHPLRTRKPIGKAKVKMKLRGQSGQTRSKDYKRAGQTRSKDYEREGSIKNRFAASYKVLQIET